MIAGCIDRMREGACSGCARRDDCAALLRWFDPGRAKPRRPARPFRRAATTAGASPLLSLLTALAAAVDGWANGRRVERIARERRDGAEAQGQALQPARPGAFCARVEQAVEPLLAAGGIRVAGVARALGVSRQTLYRRLKAEGTTFEKLLDGLRHRLASRLLGEGMAVKDIAYRLGFSDPAAFSRAFKRWTGASPSASR